MLPPHHPRQLSQKLTERIELRLIPLAAHPSNYDE